MSVANQALDRRVRSLNADELREYEEILRLRDERDSLEDAMVELAGELESLEDGEAAARTTIPDEDLVPALSDLIAQRIASIAEDEAESNKTEVLMVLLAQIQKAELAEMAERFLGDAARGIITAETVEELDDWIQFARLFLLWGSRLPMTEEERNTMTPEERRKIVDIEITERDDSWLRAGPFQAPAPKVARLPRPAIRPVTRDRAPRSQRTRTPKQPRGPGREPDDPHDLAGRAGR